MRINAFHPDYLKDEIFRADIWQEDSNGTPRRNLCNYGLSDFWVKIPDFIALKHKNRKLSAVLIMLDSLGNIKDVDVHYGRFTINGYTIRYSFDFFDNMTVSDVTKAYRI